MIWKGITTKNPRIFKENHYKENKEINKNKKLLGGHCTTMKKNEYENLVDLLTYLVEKEITAKRKKDPQPPHLPPPPQILLYRTPLDWGGNYAVSHMKRPDLFWPRARSRGLISLILYPYL